MKLQAAAEALGQTGTSNEVASERHQIRVACRENRLGAVPGGAAGHDEGAAEPWAKMLSRDRRLALDDKLGALGSERRRGGRRCRAGPADRRRNRRWRREEGRRDV